MNNEQHSLLLLSLWALFWLCRRVRMNDDYYYAELQSETWAIRSKTRSVFMEEIIITPTTSIHWFMILSIIECARTVLVYTKVQYVPIHSKYIPSFIFFLFRYRYSHIILFLICNKEDWRCIKNVFSKFYPYILHDYQAKLCFWITELFKPDRFLFLLPFLNNASKEKGKIKHFLWTNICLADVIIFIAIHFSHWRIWGSFFMNFVNPGGPYVYWKF